MTGSNSPRPSLLLRATLARVVVLAALLAATVPVSATAAPVGAPPNGKILLGIGGTAIGPVEFGTLTRSPHELHLVTAAWNESRPWSDALRKRLEQAESGSFRLMVHIGATRVDNGREGRSPGAVSRGAADAYLLDLGRVVNESEQWIYVRPPAEMNGHWSVWSAFNRNGTRRNADHSTKMYRRAFIRIALIVRGGDVALINRRLAANGMPALATAETWLPRSGRVAMVWNPQAEGSPNVRGNEPQAYYPGAPWVDFVANDLYVQSGRAHWTAHERLYARYQRAHPFMVAEYAPWGYDDPAFIRRMFDWAATHPRTVALLYFNGTAGPTFALANKPRSLAMYRKLAAGARYRCAGFGPFSATC